jgi:hypothetical protein
MRTPVEQQHSVSSDQVLSVDYSNARYMENLGRAVAANLHGRMTPDQAEVAVMP